MKLLFTIRTADRSPKRNYLGETVRSLIAGGVDLPSIHICSTSPDVRWLRRAYPEFWFSLNVPTTPRTANENGIALIDWFQILGSDADWIVLSEDDLEWCADPIGSITRWLERYATPEHMVYRFFAFDRLMPTSSSHAMTAPLREMKGSQVIAMRASDARRFQLWARRHPLDWRPKDAPFQDHPHDGFDKLVGYWALQDRPAVRVGIVSVPFFVRHIGVESSLHHHGRCMDREFAGVGWSYGATAFA